MTEEKLQQELLWWQANYEIVSDYDLLSRTYIGQKNSYCRFCGKSYPEVKFSDEAHAIPAALGNSTLFTNNECNGCNHLFGETIEDGLNKYFLPYRMSARIRGGKGKLKYHADEFNTLELKDGKITATQTESGAIVELVDDHEFRLKFTRQSYRPIDVYKALVKIGITILPESELPNFDQTVAWLRHGEKTIEDYFGQFVMVRFFPGDKPFPFGKAFVLKRKESDFLGPCYYLVFCFYHFNIQIVLPSIKNDLHLDGRKFDMKSFPTILDIGNYPGDVGSGLWNLSGRDMVRGEEYSVTMHYESIKRD